MKLGAVVFLSLILAGCISLGGQPKPTVKESYYTPVIQSDVSSSGYIPTVTPVVRVKTAPRIYTPVLR